MTRRREYAHCPGCGETWVTSLAPIGMRCTVSFDPVTVRLATPAEIAAYNA